MNRMGECIFCRIVKGEIPSFKLYEDDKCIVILDNFPATKGQSLVITKEHKDYVMDLDDITYGHIFNVAKNVSKVIDNALKTVRTCMVVEGFAVSHVHIRLHPCYQKNLLLKGKEGKKEELEKVAKLIKSRL